MVGECRDRLLVDRHRAVGETVDPVDGGQAGRQRRIAECCPLGLGEVALGVGDPARPEQGEAPVDCQRGVAGEGGETRAVEIVRVGEASRPGCDLARLLVGAEVVGAQGYVDPVGLDPLFYVAAPYPVLRREEAQVRVLGSDDDGLRQGLQCVEVVARQ